VKDIGLIGVPYSGKSTLFTALTRTGAAGGRANQAVVPVPDHRLGVLAELERSRRIVPAQVRFLDAPGGTSAQGLAALRATDALCLVLRAFGPDANAGRELNQIRTDLLLADLAVVEGALENARRKSKGRGPNVLQEIAALERGHTSLSAETPLSEAGLDEDDVKFLKGLAPLTLKPWVLVANLEEGMTVPGDLPEGALGVFAEIEAETAAMSPEEARELLAEFGVKEPGLERVIAACYGALDLIIFLTTGEDETRAWEVRRGAKAPEAAGVVHSDMERGFIRAEVVSYDELVAAGGWDAAKNQGHLRVEGKDYVIREGDVLHVRFSV
jgi:GTP-binding protein YchF